MSTLSRLKKRLAKIEQEATQLRAEISALEGVPAQVDFPGIPSHVQPPREPTVFERMGSVFQASRKKKLEDLGIAFVPDERNEPAFYVVTFKRILAAGGGEPARVFEAIDSFFAEDWPAAKAPPYPFRIFAAEKVWRRMLEETAQ